jgi:hypothetical protein
MALVIAVSVLRASPSAAGVAVTLVVVAIGVAVATWPIAGRTAEEWAPDATRHLALRLRGPRAAPDPFAGIRLIRVELGSAAKSRSTETVVRSGAPTDAVVSCAGVLHDLRRRTFTAVLRAAAPGFVLASADEKIRRIDAWSGVLASLAREKSTVYRVQWIERIVRSSEALGGFAPNQTDVSAAPELARTSYDSLLSDTSRDAARHEVLLAVGIHAGEAARIVKTAGGGDAGACTVLLRETAELRRRLADAGVEVGPVLDPDELAVALRRAYRSDPAPRPAPRPAGPAWPWPMGIAAEWSRLRIDDTWVATYWVAEWPRTDVGPDFLGSLLLHAEVGRAVSLVMKPLSPSAASRKVAQARTADIADAELRRRGGFLATARRRREEELLARREVELADGHAHYRFSGYVTVSAAEPDALGEACSRIEQVAGQAGMELRRCYGNQVNAFLCTLPLCRGLS